MNLLNRFRRGLVAEVLPLRKEAFEVIYILNISIK